MIRYLDVSKKYGEVVALDNISLDIEDGKITALLGPNGSGKTTLFKITLGVLRPDSGKIYIDDLDVVENPIEARRIIGYSPEDITLFESLTPLEMFNFISKVYGLRDKQYEKQLQLYITLFNLNSYMNKLCGELSHGNRRKVSLVSALLHDPKVLLLDEPFTGLDPEAGRILKEILKKNASENKVVMFSTHILEIAEAVADYIIIINNGRVVAEGSPDELRDMMQYRDLESVFLEVTGLSREVEQLIRTLWGE